MTMRLKRNDSMLLCEHANERPNVCPCPPTCACRTTMCLTVKTGPANMLRKALDKFSNDVEAAVRHAIRIEVQRLYVHDPAATKYVYNGRPVSKAAWGKHYERLQKRWVLGKTTFTVQDRDNVMYLTPESSRKRPERRR